MEQAEPAETSDDDGGAGAVRGRRPELPRQSEDDDMASGYLGTDPAGGTQQRKG